MFVEEGLNLTKVSDWQMFSGKLFQSAGPDTGPSQLLEWILSKPRLPWVVALNNHLVYLGPEGSQEQVLLGLFM